MAKNDWDDGPSGHEGRELKDLVSSAARSGAICTHDLGPGDLLTVETASGSVYRFRLVDPVRGLVTDESAKPLWAAGESIRLIGSRLGGRVLSQWRVMCGHRLEITHTSRRREAVPGFLVPYTKVTTPVRRVLVNGVQFLPAPASRQFKS